MYPSTLDLAEVRINRVNDLNDADEDEDDFSYVASHGHVAAGAPSSSAAPMPSAPSAAAASASNIVIDSHSSQLECPLCMEMLRNNLECKNCHSLYCRDCVENWRKKQQGPTGSTCPSCRAPFRHLEDQFQHNVAVQRLADAMPSRCQYCCHTVPRSDLEEHVLRYCEHAPATCKYAKIGCKWAGSRADLDHHISSECRYSTQEELVAKLAAADAIVSRLEAEVAERKQTEKQQQDRIHSFEESIMKMDNAKHQADIKLQRQRFALNGALSKYVVTASDAANVEANASSGVINTYYRNGVNKCSDMSKKLTSLVPQRRISAFESIPNAGLALGQGSNLVIADTQSSKIINISDAHTSSIDAIGVWYRELFQDDALLPGEQDYFVCTGSTDKKLRLWQVPRNPQNTQTLPFVPVGVREALVNEFVGHEAPVTCLSTESTSLFSGAADHTIIEWDPNRPVHHNQRRHYRGHENAITALSWNPWLQLLVTASSDLSLRIFDSRLVDPVVEVRNAHQRSISCFCTHQDDSNYALYSGGLDGAIKKWDIRFISQGGQQPQRTAQAVQQNQDTGAIYSLVSLEKQKIASIGDAAIKIWTTSEASLLQKVWGLFSQQSALLNTVSAPSSGHSRRFMALL